MSRNQPWSEEDLEAAKQRMMVRGAGNARTVRGGQSKTGEAGERSACTPSGLRRNRSHAEATTRTLQNGPSPINKNAKYAPYKNKLEHSYAQVLAMEKQAGKIKDWGYETQSLKLAAGKYHRPDFTVWHLDGTVEMAQTKGYHRNMRASMTGLIWAAQRHPWFRFTIHRYKNGWQSEEVTP